MIMHASWEPSIEAVAAAMEKYEKMQKKYLDKYGKHSLDRVIMGDPGWPNVADINECTKKLEIAIKNDAPIEQIPEKIWNNIVF